jgi:hypothetical protein
MQQPVPREPAPQRPKPPPQQAEEAVPEAPPSDVPWGLPPELIDGLARQSAMYREYAVRFTCTEEARVAHYDRNAEATSEKQNRYAYLLERGQNGEPFREVREALKKSSKKKQTGDAAAAESTGREVEDQERFPPAYAWVFLFDRDQQPYFMYRDVGDRFEGFDWVHEIQFRGAIPFSDGKDIREWEGTVLVDAVTLTPIEIRAEPASQMERIRVEFDRWSKAFNLAGAHLAPRPFGYRCRVVFGLRRDRLTFPTELRYDTFRATGPRQFIPWMASVRTYDEYRFFKTSAVPTPGAPVPR